MARPSTSCPASVSVRVAAWIGKAVRISRRSSAVTSFCGRPSLAKDVSVGAGAAAAAFSNQASSSRSAARVCAAADERRGRAGALAAGGALGARDGRRAAGAAAAVERFGRRSGRAGVRAEGIRMVTPGLEAAPEGCATGEGGSSSRGTTTRAARPRERRPNGRRVMPSLPLPGGRARPSCCVGGHSAAARACPAPGLSSSGPAPRRLEVEDPAGRRLGLVAWEPAVVEGGADRGDRAHRCRVAGHRPVGTGPQRSHRGPGGADAECARRRRPSPASRS